MVKSILMYLLLLVLLSCSKLNPPDDSISLIREDYNGDKLSFNGYYYTEIETYDGVIFSRYAFYRNGIIRYLGSSNSLQEVNFIMIETKQIWGVFQIENNNLKFERWYPSSSGPLKAYVREGEIFNDTTFRITESYRNQNGQKTEIDKRDEVFHFKSFSSKPDSINSFIK